MGLIEQAAKRLEELRRAGVDVPRTEAPDPPVAARSSAATPGIPERAMRAAADVPGLFRDPSAVDPAKAGSVPGVAPAAASRRSRLVEIDLQRLAAAGYVTPSVPRSRLADEMRVIKRPLIGNAQGRSAAPVRGANLIMVTSALPNEGKTFIAINLAISIAMEIDTTVLLVDADVARPAVPERLGIAQETGLLDLVTRKDLDLADVMVRTNIERLSVLTAGTPHSRATELLASDSMTRLVDELASRYPDRILIFDAPPLLSSTESRVLAAHMGQILLVVEADRTPQSRVKQALETIEQCPVVMTILNKIERPEAGSYSDGYYGAYGQ